MTPAVTPRPADLIPHHGDAVLLDEINSIDHTRVSASFVVRSDSAFCDDAGNLPAWAGPELMAQAISALAGFRWLKSRGRPAPIGLLLGVRAYQSGVPVFLAGQALQVEVAESSEDDAGMAVFDGRILIEGRPVASGTVTVFQPPDDDLVMNQDACDE